MKNVTSVALLFLKQKEYFKVGDTRDSWSNDP